MKAYLLFYIGTTFVTFGILAFSSGLGVHEIFNRNLLFGKDLALHRNKKK